MASGGEGFGTERARLAGDGLSTERARLAQGGFLGQFYKRNPFKRNLWKSQNFAQKREGGVNFSKEIPLNEISENPKILLKNPLRRIRYFCTFFSQNPDPHKEFNFSE